MAAGFFGKPYDAGTIAKLTIFELYTQEWIPVFVSRPNPPFREVHIFDFFCGPGADSAGVHGSPIRVLDQLRRYERLGMAGWNKVSIVAHLFDRDPRQIETLRQKLQTGNWSVHGVKIDCRPVSFEQALAEHRALLKDAGCAKLLIIDQYGVDDVSDEVFKELIEFPTTDFIFFLPSSMLHRFRDHPAIKRKIDRIEDSYDVHRAAFKYFRDLASPNDVFLGSFSIRKPKGNIYGLIFGSHHPLGIQKFLQVAWGHDEIAGEANFDIERENIRPGEGILPLDVMQPNKVRAFEEDLEEALKSGRMRSEADVVRFCIEAGMTCQHSGPVLKKLKDAGLITLDFRVPDVGRLKTPRPITLNS